MAAGNGIIIKSGAGVDIKASREKGIFIGSDNKISLFANGFNGKL